MSAFQKKDRRTLHLEDAARFNRALDTNQRLCDGMAELTRQYPYLSEKEYTEKMLALFSQAGLELTESDLRVLLAMRRETDRILLSERPKGSEVKP